MEVSTAIIIAALVVGGFLIFQDYYEIPPEGFSFSPEFYVGTALIIGAIVVLGILSITRKKAKASNPETWR